MILQLNVESTLELDYQGASTPIGPNGPRSKLVYLVGMDYEGQIDYRFPFVQKGILVIMKGCIEVSEQGLQIELID